MGIKNNFGITPTALYSHHEPNEQSTVGPHRPLPLRQGAARGRPAAGARPGFAAPADLPRPPAHGRRPGHPPDRPDHHRRHRDGFRRRGAVALEPGSPAAGPAPRRPQPGLHRLRRHRRDGLRPDGSARAPAPSPATTTWPWPPPSDWARTTPPRSKCAGCPSRKPSTPSAGCPPNATADHAPGRGPNSSHRRGKWVRPSSPLLRDGGRLLGCGIEQTETTSRDTTGDASMDVRAAIVTTPVRASVRTAQPPTSHVSATCPRGDRSHDRGWRLHLLNHRLTPVVRPRAALMVSVGSSCRTMGSPVRVTRAASHEPVSSLSRRALRTACPWPSLLK